LKIEDGPRMRHSEESVVHVQREWVTRA